MKELKINRGIELMLRRATKKDQQNKPSKGFMVNKNFSLLKHKVYFNFELRWEQKKISSELNND